MNKRNNVTLNDRIQVRAYYLWINGSEDTLANWLVAEAEELRLLEKRKASAAKATATRKAKAAVISTAPSEHSRMQCTL